jgi:hypothetical protein
LFFRKKEWDVSEQKIFLRQDISNLPTPAVKPPALAVGIQGRLMRSSRKELVLYMALLYNIEYEF